VADCEKTFMQVGFQPPEQISPAFLWLKDLFNSVTKNSLQVYRFARVLVRVATSLSLLGAITLFHLDLVRTPTAEKIMRHMEEEEEKEGRTC